MNIKWAYYLIAIIYVILIVLKGINYLNLKAYEKENADVHKAVIFKKDFFTTVALICIVVTCAINIAAIIGGKNLNTSSIIITCFVIGFTMINSFEYIRFSDVTQTLFLAGYTLKDGDIEKVKYKQGSRRNALRVTLTREIESYYYIKMSVYGKNKDQVVTLLEKLQKPAEVEVKV